MADRLPLRARRGRVRATALTLAGVACLGTMFAPRATPSDSRVMSAPESRSPVAGALTDRLVVRLKNPAPTPGGKRQALSAGHARALGARAAIDVAPVRVTADGAHVLRLPGPLAPADLAAVIARLAADPTVAHVEPDYRLAPASAPTDPAYAYQWNLADPAGGIDVESVWAQGSRGKGVVVAVLDTGVLPHRDLMQPASRLLPGYDFVAADSSGAFGAYATANDGNGRDPDAADPGNWLEVAEVGAAPFVACPAIEGMATFRPSDWHGTRIAGIIAANADNGYGIAGIAPEAMILPVRVMGKCGGYSSDIADGIRWAAGLAVEDAPANANPARVINLSVSMRIDAACPAVLASAIAAAEAAGSIVVKAVGNNGMKAVSALTDPTSVVTPLNCAGGVNVTALARDGNDAPYSNRLHKKTGLAAPGGLVNGLLPANDPRSYGGILSLYDTGVRAPESDAFAFVTGTSEAAAHVAGVLALMISARPDATVDALKEDLLATARAFNTGSNCIHPATGWESSCGSGVVDAAAAVNAVRLRAQSAAAANSSGGAETTNGTGGGGAGGCTADPGGKPDMLLALVVLAALGRFAMRRSGKGSPPDRASSP